MLKCQNPLALFFFLINTESGLLARIEWSICIWKSQRISCISFSRKDPSLCIYHLSVRSNLDFLHYSQWITFSNQSCLLLYSFCVGFLHLLFMWLTVSCLVWHNIHWLFFCILLFFHSLQVHLYWHQLVVFHQIFTDSKSPQVSRTFLGILANLNTTVICMILSLPLISNSASLFSKLLGTIPSTSSIRSITVTFMLHSFFSSLARFKNCCCSFCCFNSPLLICVLYEHCE